MKKITINAALFMFLIGPSTLATSGKMKSADALSTGSTAQAFKGQLKAGFHFNDKAPNQLIVDGKEILPKKLSAQSIEFQLPSQYEKATAALYVCDDAVTVCEIHNIEIKGNSNKKISTFKNSMTKKPKKSHGFIQDDLGAALKEAKEKNKLVLIDFSARWCPGCVRYEKEVFTTQEFQKSAKDFVKVKIDVDRFENFDLSEKYKIVGIPTFVFVNADEKEIDRLVDFYPIEKLKPLLASVLADPTPMSDLLAQKNLKDPAMRLKIGKKLFASGQYARSLDFLGTIQPEPPELLFAKISLAQENYKNDETKKDALIKELRAALSVDPESTRSLSWRLELMGLLDSKSEEVKKLSNEGQKLAEALLADSQKMQVAIATDYIGDFLGYERLLVALYKAELTAATSDASAAWASAADIGASYKISPKKTGPAMRYLSALRSAKRLKEAESYAQQILKFDPQNEDIKRRKMDILLAQEKFKEAASLGEKIIHQAVGRNQFMVAEGLAKAYIGLKKTDSAKRLLTAYLSRPEIQTDKMKSFRKKMDDLLKKI